MTAPKSNDSRIPHTLQSVFLASNRGRHVDKPPPNYVATRVFRTWFSKRPTGGQKVVVSIPTISQAPKRTESMGSNKSKSRDIKLEPQKYFDSLLRSRGYLNVSYPTLESAYYNKPSDLQLASYDLYLVDIARNNDKDQIKNMLQAGLSPNPCNMFGESLIHMICRRGYADLLRLLITEYDCDIQIADDYGRTPLHDACWSATPCFEVVEMLLARDPNLIYMADARGSLPLSYVHKKHWCEWIEFLNAHKETYWPKRGTTMLMDSLPPLCALAPNSRPLEDPVNACSLQIAKMVASGKLHPSEAMMLQTDDDMDDKDNTESPTDENDDDDSEYEVDSYLQGEKQEDSEFNEIWPLQEVIEDDPTFQKIKDQ